MRRRIQGNPAAVTELEQLIVEGRAKIIGPIRQELLSGIRDEAQYQKLRRHLRAFTDEPLLVEDYEEAARMSNICRAEGVSGSAIDFLIAASAQRRNWAIFTLDNDFHRYAGHLPLKIHGLR